MKNTMFGAIAALGLSTATAHANELSFIGETEYAFEAEVFSLEGGAEYTYDRFTFSGVALFDNDSVDDDFEFTGLEFEGGYAITDSVSAYIRLELDEDAEYDETVAGMSFKF